MKIEDFLIKMWKDYSELNPHIIKVLQLIKNKESNKIINDHIALRTFNHKKVNRHILSKYFVENGYKPVEDLFFTKKKLKATYYIHSNPSLPRIFISELLLENFSNSLQQIINKKIEEIDDKLISNPIFLTSGIPWNPIDFETYKNIQKESDYASWVLAMGYIANHFTVSVTDCSYFKNLEQLNNYLKENGFEINLSGGEIKGSKKQGLEQSSIMSKEILVNFSNGLYKVPGCYYEFAYRYNNFNGFITQSANHIFESTNEKKEN
tara:strand:- start:1193 stop:1987 length:795 start_codon:yes stop_codon:yes gene_type:complete